MLKKNRVIGVAAFSILFSFHAMANQPTIFSCHDLLSPDALESLHAALADEYDAQVLVKMVNGKPKTVVLLGEGHVKSVASAQVGRQVVRNFGKVGVENYDSSRTWGGKLPSISSLLQKMGAKVPAPFFIARLIGSVMGENLTEQNTMSDAYASSLRTKIIDELKGMPRNELHELLMKLEKIPENERDEITTFGSARLYSTTELIQWIGTILEGSSPDMPTTDRRETVMIESGHVPDIWENIDSIKSYISYGILAGYFSAAYFSPAVANNYLLMAIPFFTAGYELLTQTLAVSQTVRQKTWYQRLFPLGLAVINGRDSTMVGNIDQTISERDDVTEFLVIVGKDHIPGIKAKLMQRGYVFVPLPTGQQMATDNANNFGSRDG